MIFAAYNISMSISRFHHLNPFPFIADGDMKIGLQDLPLLSLRLQIQLDPYGITLDTDKFEAMIREDNGEPSKMMVYTIVDLKLFPTLNQTPPLKIYQMY